MAVPTPAALRISRGTVVGTGGEPVVGSGGGPVVDSGGEP